MFTRIGLLAVLGLFVIVTGCRPDVDDPETVMTIDDVHSHARAAEARVSHVSLDLTVDFTNRTLRGTAALTVVRTGDADELVLDTNDLRISGVRDQAGHALPYSLGDADALLGPPHNEP